MTPPALTPMRLAKLRNAQELVHDATLLLGDTRVDRGMRVVTKERLAAVLTTLDQVQTLIDGALEMGA